MWRRLRRRSFAPNRPPLWPEQWGLALFSALALIAGIAVVVILLTHG